MPTNKPIALITGGTRGIGLGIATALAREGYDLAVNGVRPEGDVADTLVQLRSHGGRVVYCRGDVGIGKDRTAIVDRVRKELGALHVLVNCAGITSPGRKDLLDATEEAFDQVMAVNLKGRFFLTQLFARWIIEQHERDKSFRGCVINISSVSGQLASMNRGDYCLSWAATAMATKLWAVRLAPHGIAVYEIRPGIIETDMTAPVKEKYDKLIAEGLLLEPRWGTPEDIGRAAAALCRGDIPYATGQVLTIDGGMTIQRL
ncbi:MAG: 3-ketoacyl-ACP reductase [Pirellulales bacterium]